METRPFKCCIDKWTWKFSETSEHRFWVNTALVNGCPESNFALFSLFPPHESMKSTSHCIMISSFHSLASSPFTNHPTITAYTVWYPNCVNKYSEEDKPILRRKRLYEVLVVTPEGKARLERRRHRWEKNIKVGEMSRVLRALPSALHNVAQSHSCVLLPLRAASWCNSRLSVYLHAEREPVCYVRSQRPRSISRGQ
jgi:hypothetical protein